MCYATTDHLGSVRVVTDRNGTAVAQHDYSPFGEKITVSPASSDVEQRFTGQIRDTETGIDFFNARYYTASLGRFNSVDPENTGADLSDPQTWNGYNYARNNSLAFTDPTGQFMLAPGEGSSGASPNPVVMSDPVVAGDLGAMGIVVPTGNTKFSITHTEHAPVPTVSTPASAAKNVFSTPDNCVAGFTAAGAGVGATAGVWVGGGIGGADGAAGGTLVAPGVGTIGDGVLGAESGAAGGALVSGGLGASAGYLVGSIVCSFGISISVGGAQNRKLRPSEISKLEVETGESVHQIKAEALGTNKNIAQYDLHKDVYDDRIA